VFVSEGYEAATMRKIAERLDCSPTLLYFHFTDKAALLRELCVSDYAALAARQAHLLAVEDPVERLRALARTYVTFAVEHPNHYEFMFMVRHPTVELEEDRRLHLQNPEQDGYAALKLTVEQALALGRLRADLEPDLIAQMLWSSLHGAIALPRTLSGRVECEDPWIGWRPVEQIAMATFEAMLRGLLAEPARAGRTALPHVRRRRPARAR
jgi:AcrR family transcriptional regulator